MSSENLPAQQDHEQSKIGLFTSFRAVIMALLSIIRHLVEFEQFKTLTNDYNHPQAVEDLAHQCRMAISYLHSVIDNITGTDQPGHYPCECDDCATLRIYQKQGELELDHYPGEAEMIDSSLARMWAGFISLVKFSSRWKSFPASYEAAIDNLLAFVKMPMFEDESAEMTRDREADAARALDMATLVRSYISDRDNRKAPIKTVEPSDAQELDVHLQRMWLEFDTVHHFCIENAGHQQIIVELPPAINRMVEFASRSIIDGSPDPKAGRRAKRLGEFVADQVYISEPAPPDDDYDDFEDNPAQDNDIMLMDGIGAMYESVKEIVSRTNGEFQSQLEPHLEFLIKNTQENKLAVKMAKFLRDVCGTAASKKAELRRQAREREETVYLMALGIIGTQPEQRYKITDEESSVIIGFWQSHINRHVGAEEPGIHLHVVCCDDGMCVIQDLAAQHNGHCSWKTMVGWDHGHILFHSEAELWAAVTRLLEEPWVVLGEDRPGNMLLVDHRICAGDSDVVNRQLDKNLAAKAVSRRRNPRAYKPSSRVVEATQHWAANAAPMLAGYDEQMQRIGKHPEKHYQIQQVDAESGFWPWGEEIEARFQKVRFLADGETPRDYWFDVVCHPSNKALIEATANPDTINEPAEYRGVLYGEDVTWDERFGYAIGVFNYAWDERYFAALDRVAGLDWVVIVHDHIGEQTAVFDRLAVTAGQSDKAGA